MPVHLVCPVCGVNFTRKPAAIRPTNCCTVRCSTKLNYSLHGVNKGRRNAPATEFKSGTIPHNHTPVGTVRVRQRHNRTEAPRAFVKVAEPNVWQYRALLVFEQAHGPRTRGRVIHHINGDSLDDRPENLVELTRAEHAAVHAGTSSKIPS